MAIVLPSLDERVDRFQLGARAGAGSMGDVYRALDSLTGGTVAVKVLRNGASETERLRFQREIGVLADLRHPNVVEYLAHGTLPDGRPFFAMEWLEGEDLGRRQRHTPLGMRDAVEVVRRSCQAIAAVHARGVVHRDLKLANLFLIESRGLHVKLIDFGVVRLPGDDPQFDRGTILGTPNFMAPEQARGEEVDARADVYSLGAALFRLITGRNIFETDHLVALLGRLVIEDPPAPSTVRFDVPEALDRVIHRAIARRAQDRFENAGELARALARVGELANDPPNHDKSSSVVRSNVPSARPSSGGTRTGTQAGTGTGSRSGTGKSAGSDSGRARREVAERRVVAAVMFDVGATPLDEAGMGELWQLLGVEARVETLLGGRMICVLGLSESKGDEHIRAARAALAITNARHDVRAVVAVGHATIASQQGSRGRAASLAGQALERAAQQLELTPPGTVRVDPSVVAVLAGRFVLEEDTAGATLLREDSSGFGTRLLLGRPTPTVGRDKELALLSTVYEELLDEVSPRSVLVTGPAGTGKTRVRQELSNRLELMPQPPEIVLLRGEPMTQGSSLSCFGRAMRRMVGVHDGETLTAQQEKVRLYMNFRLPRPLRFLVGFLAELLGVPFSDQGDEPLRAARRSPQLMQSRTRAALESLFRAQADMLPQLLVIEDGHWIDETTIDLIDWLLGCSDLRLAVYVFARPEIDARFPTLWANRNVTRLALPPLSRSACEKLVRVALPQAEAQLRTSLVERSGGNALFLEELVRATAAGQDELPLTVQSLLQLRLDRMPREMREVVRAASVLGPVFWTGAVEHLLERSPQDALEELARTEVVTQQPASRIRGEVEWIFRQALLRDAAYASILEEDRTELHRIAATWLESKGDADVGLIAQHADAGEDFERAATLYARATRQAYSNGAHLEIALELAERGLDCGPSGELLADLTLAAAQARLPLGRLEEGIRAAEQAVDLSEPGTDRWAEAQCLAAVALVEHGRASEGEARTATALAPGVVERVSGPIRAHLMAARVRALIDLSRPVEALEVANSALGLARALGSNEALLRVHDARLFALMQVSDASEVVASGPGLIAIADTAGDVVNATRARVNVASSMNLIGLFEEARNLLNRALTDARDRRMRILEAFALHNLGMTEARLGFVDRGLEMQREAGRIADETGAARLRINARVYEAMLLLWRYALARSDRPSPSDASDLAAAWGLAAFVDAEVRHFPPLAFVSRFIMAAVAFSRRQLVEARSLSEDAVRVSHERPVEEWEEFAHLTLVETLLALGDHDAAGNAVDAAFAIVAGRAGRFARAEHRAAYLERIPEVRRLVELARHLRGRILPSFAMIAAPPQPPRS